MQAIMDILLAAGVAVSLFLHYMNRSGKHPEMGKVADAIDTAEGDAKKL